MKIQKKAGLEDPSDEQIIQVLRDARDADTAFTATREFSLEKMRIAIKSRGDYFDRKGAVVFEMNGEEVFRVSMCNLPVIIGRGEKVDCRLDFEGVSRLHCRIESVGNLMRICDVGSKNGTWLNGKLIDCEDLCDGDVVKVGTVSLRVNRL